MEILHSDGHWITVYTNGVKYGEDNCMIIILDTPCCNKNTSIPLAPDRP